MKIYSSKSEGIEVQFEPAVSEGVYYENTGLEMVLIRNNRAASIDVTFVIQTTIDGVPPVQEGKVINVPGGKMYVCGPFDPSIYNHKSGPHMGRTKIKFSEDENVSVAILRLLPYRRGGNFV